jgi:hypothetical protein
MNHDMATTKLANGVYLYAHPVDPAVLVECVCEGCKQIRKDAKPYVGPSYWFQPVKYREVLI